MKIRRNAWRGWVRLGFKMVAVIGFLYGLFGLWFGVERVRDNEIMHEGDLVLFCRIGNDYGAGDLLTSRSDWYGEQMKASMCSLSIVVRT